MCLFVQNAKTHGLPERDVHQVDEYRPVFGHTLSESESHPEE